MTTRQRPPKRKAAAAALDAITGVELRSKWVAKEFNFGGIDLPHDIMTFILSYLSKPELVHRVSLVSSSWLVASENPDLWPCLEEKIWKQTNQGKHKCFSSMKRFLEFLRRPQFAKLKSLGPPSGFDRTLNRNIHRRVAESCPLLEELDLFPSFALTPYEDELHLIPSTFPNLQRLMFGVPPWKYPEESWVQFFRDMGDRLVVFEIIGSHPLFINDRIINALGQSCPNLRRFAYREYFDSHDPVPLTDSVEVTHQPFINLIQTCSKLRYIEICVRDEDDAGIDLLDSMDLFKEENKEKFPMLEIALKIDVRD